MIVLDDLHWADEPSLLLLRFAAKEVGSSGLLILGTYRDVELGRHHPLARVLGDISGSEASARIPLRGLTVAAVERYIEMTSSGPAPPGLARAVQEQTDGNPFFVGEIVRLLASEGKLTRGAPPPSSRYRRESGGGRASPRPAQRAYERGPADRRRDRPGLRV